jgi:DMSO reductase anchor subunit
MLAGAATVLFGMAGIAASARLYLVPGRPAWDSPITFFEFFSTVALLGFAVWTVLSTGGAGSATGVSLAASTTMAVLIVKIARLALSSRYELYASWQLLSTMLLNKLLVRVLLLVTGTLVVILGHGASTWVPGLLLLVAGEFMGRYLFFVSVVPTSMASGYLASEAA